MLAPALPRRTYSRMGWTQSDELSQVIVDPKHKAEFVPAIRVLGVAAAALDSSAFRDFAIGGDGPCRYWLLVTDQATFAAELQRNDRLLSLILALALRYQASLLSLCSGSVRFGYLLSARHLIGVQRPILVGATSLDWLSDRYPGTQWDCYLWPSGPQMEQADYVSTTIKQRLATIEFGSWISDPDELLERALDAEPIFPDLTHLISAPTNDLYGVRRIMVQHCGLYTDLLIPGKLQHGWAPNTACGIDGEQGYRDEVYSLGLPAYVWSAGNAVEAAALGLNAICVGAPGLYLRSAVDPGPSTDRLLCFPTHSIGGCRALLDWPTYARETQFRARLLGFGGATICVHHDDDAPEVRAAIRATGARFATLGREPDGFLYRMRDLIWEHKAVTSDRLCTSGFYSLLWGRPFFISGTPVLRDPPELEHGTALDPLWISDQFPNLLRYDGSVHREYVERELGVWLTPDQLRCRLFGWLGL